MSTMSNQNAVVFVVDAIIMHLGKRWYVSVPFSRNATEIMPRYYDIIVRSYVIITLEHMALVTEQVTDHVIIIREICAVYLFLVS